MTLLTQDEVDALQQTEQLLVRRQMNPHLNNETFWALERIRLHIIREIQEDEKALAAVFATGHALAHRAQQERWARLAHSTPSPNTLSSVQNNELGNRKTHKAIIAVLASALIICQAYRHIGIAFALYGGFHGATWPGRDGARGCLTPGAPFICSHFLGMLEKCCKNRYFALVVRKPYAAVCVLAASGESGIHERISLGCSMTFYAVTISVAASVVKRIEPSSSAIIGGQASIRCRI